MYTKLAADRFRFVRAHLPQRGRLLDIGCGKGDFLAHMRLSTDLDLYGLEPSASSDGGMDLPGVGIVSGWIEDLSSAEFGEFDAISLISVLEHLYDPLKAVKEISVHLSEKGLFLVEVPDSTRPFLTIDDFYTYEHLSHFSIGSLIALMQRAGMEVIDIDRSENADGRLRICARKSDGTLYTGLRSVEAGDRVQLRECVKKYAAERREFEAKIVARVSGLIDQWKKKGLKIAIYGAGVHTLFLHELLDFGPEVLCILDSDERKHGGSFLNWKVYGPRDIERLKLDAILISSHKFESEIYDSIKHLEQKGIRIAGCYTI